MPHMVAIVSLAQPWTKRRRCWTRGVAAMRKGCATLSFARMAMRTTRRCDGAAEESRRIAIRVSQRRRRGSMSFDHRNDARLIGDGRAFTGASSSLDRRCDDGQPCSSDEGNRIAPVLGSPVAVARRARQRTRNRRRKPEISRSLPPPNVREQPAGPCHRGMRLGTHL